MTAIIKVTNADLRLIYFLKINDISTYHRKIRVRTSFSKDIVRSLEYMYVKINILTGSCLLDAKTYVSPGVCRGLYDVLKCFPENNMIDCLFVSYFANFIK